MGSFLRSEKIKLYQMVVQTEAAYQILSAIGENGTMQFRDLHEGSSAAARTFYPQVKQCEEMERKLRYIQDQVKKEEIPIPDVEKLPNAPNPREIIDLEAYLEKIEGDIRELRENAIQLKSRNIHLIEGKNVLEKSEGLFAQYEEETNDDSANKALISNDFHNAASGGRLKYIAGVIDRERVPGFERMLWRVSRGNVFLKRTEIDHPIKDPASGELLHKTVFIAFFQGEQLKSRVEKVCSGYHATMYYCPSSKTDRKEMAEKIKMDLEDIQVILNQTDDHRMRVLRTVAKELVNWIVMVRKMKAIYHILNYFKVEKRILIGQCWIPKLDEEGVKLTLAKASEEYGDPNSSYISVLTTKDTPPTLNRTNKFTQGFQNLIDAYGMCSYREANPALYTIITFPFLFAVMFGDVGHAIILLLFGLYLVLSEKKLEKTLTNEVGLIFFGGRYIILLMALFSLYTGFIYNDIFSKSMNIFGSSWTYRMKNQRNNTLHTFFCNRTVGEYQEECYEFATLDPKYDYTDEPYIFGLDPIWALAKNKIIFLNSYKMKLSIIFGVLHMIFGLCVGLYNKKTRKIENIILNFIPQILFLVCLFVYMIIMMFMKWVMYSAKNEDDALGTYCAPSVLIYFINMMLFQKPKKVDIEDYPCKDYMYDQQYLVQCVLVIVAVLCIPIMLLGKPIYIGCKRKKMPPGEVQEHEGGGDDHENEPMSEVYIYQAIHTIEYVLSTISHTASYLRLWALSLAHAQLSEVLWMMVFKMGLVWPKYIGAFIVFPMFTSWSLTTVGILVAMEGLSAFLHTLRLHWVEFMSKFYEGVGYPFQPFSFKVILKEAAENEEMGG